MYAVGNVRKFVEDHAEELGERGQEILDRAELISEGGVFSGGVVGQVMGNDPKVTALFEREVASSADHIRIGVEALTAGGEPRGY